jgi:inosose dehydratase
MDPEIVARARREDLAFGQAVAQGASCEPPAGIPDVPSVVRALTDRGRDTFVIVEQDMYPVDFDVPQPIAARTRDYLMGCGIGAEEGRQT